MLIRPGQASFVIITALVAKMVQNHAIKDRHVSANGLMQGTNKTTLEIKL
jgi:hypothetical protein